MYHPLIRRDRSTTTFVHTNARWRLGRFTLGVISSLLSVAVASTSRADWIVSYESLGSTGSLSASQIAAGITARRLSRGPGLSNAIGTTFNSRGFSERSLESAMSAGDFLEWGWDSGPRWALQTLTVNYDRSSSGPAAAAILLSIDGGQSWNSIFHDPFVADNSTEDHTISLASYSSVDRAIFRLVAWNAASQSGTFDIENRPIPGLVGSRAVTVTGTPAAVPEPASAPLLAAGAAAAWWWRRRKRRTT